MIVSSDRSASAGLEKKNNHRQHKPCSVKRVGSWLVSLINTAAVTRAERMLSQSATTAGLTKNKTAILAAVVADRSIQVTDLGKRVVLSQHLAISLASNLVLHGLLEYSRLNDDTIILKPTDHGHAVARQILRSLQRPK